MFPLWGEDTLVSSLVFNEEGKEEGKEEEETEWLPFGSCLVRFLMKGGSF